MSDNRYYSHGCPPLMSDGRFVSTYVDSSVINQYIRGINKIETSNQFREYLQKNGNEILTNERKYLISKNTCNIDGKCTDDLKNGGPCRGSCRC